MSGEIKRVAIVHDWLTVYGGAERVLEQMLQVFPDADLFSLIDCLPDDQRAFIRHKSVTTSFLQRIPGIARHYRSYLGLMPLAIEQLDLSGYNLVISSSYAVAKGFLTSPDQLHLCYCYSPMRYAWDLQHQYLREMKIDHGLVSPIIRWILHGIRVWDARTANGVDSFITSSKFVARRIWKTYRRQATVLPPPVDLERFSLCPTKSSFYVTVSRLVPYKRVELIVEAFAQMPDRQLVVIGDGPEWAKVKAKATANITLLGYQPGDVVRDYLQQAQAFVFAAQEDFGIVTLEAQACGTPVIAYGKGGAVETVIPGETGLFFPEQTVASLKTAVQSFEQQRDLFDPTRIRQHAQSFSPERFQQGFATFVQQEWENFAGRSPLQVIPTIPVLQESKMQESKRQESNP